MNQRTIVYLVPSLYNSSGYEKVITFKANYLADVLGYDVTLIAYEQRGREPFFEISKKVKVVDFGLKEYETTPYAIINLFIRYAWRHRLYKECRKRWKELFSENVADVMITTLPRDASFIYKLGGAKRYVFEQHCSLDRYKWYSRNIFRRLYAQYAMRREVGVSRHYDRVILLTEEERQRYWNACKNMEVIPNPITLPETKEADLRVKRVIAVGRVSRQKGFPLLIQAWSKICRDFPDWRLSIIGAQTEAAEVVKVRCAIETSRAIHVELTGETKDIVSEYAASSIFVLSSLYEGFGLILTEAMACGLPCVSFACQCGPKDIITDGVDGLLVAEGDIQGLADAMAKLMEDEAERCRMGKQALQKAQQYSLPSVMQRWEGLFERLICE